MKPYIDVEGNLLYECPICGVYVDKEYLNDHLCTGNRDNVELIEKCFG